MKFGTFVSVLFVNLSAFLHRQRLLPVYRVSCGLRLYPVGRPMFEMAEIAKEQ